MGWLTERENWQYSLKSCRRIGVATDLTGGANFNIFQVQNAAILVRSIFGVVTTVIGAGAAVPRIQFTPNGGAQTPLCAAAATIATDAVGTVYCIGLDGLNHRLVPCNNLGYVDMDEDVWGGSFMTLLPGTIAITNAVASSGIIDWYIVYQPAASNSFVVAL